MDLQGKIWWCGDNIFIERKDEEGNFIEDELITFIKENIPENSEVKISFKVGKTTKLIDFINKKFLRKIHIRNWIKGINVSDITVSKNYDSVDIGYQLDQEAGKYFAKFFKLDPELEINFYTTYHYDDRLTSVFKISLDKYEDPFKEIQWKLERDDEAFLRGMINSYWQLRSFSTIKQWLREKRDQ